MKEPKPIYEVIGPFSIEEAEKIYARLIVKFGDEYHVTVYPNHREEKIVTRILSPRKPFWYYLFNRNKSHYLRTYITHVINIDNGYPLPDGEYETTDGIKFEIKTT